MDSSHWYLFAPFILLGIVLMFRWGWSTYFREGMEGAGAPAAPDGTQPEIMTQQGEHGEFALGLNHTSSLIPNIIWIFWDGPMNFVVEQCMESWKRYHPDYKVVILNKNTCADYLDIDMASLRHASDNPTRYSDFLRCLILSKYGGFWVDASIICHAPLTWAHSIQNRYKVEFIGYYSNSTDAAMLSYSPIIENWFFACVPESRFMQDWCAEFLRFNEFDTVDDYLESMRVENVQFVNMNYLDYLTMHASAQRVFQTNKDTYRIYLFNASSGPFKYLEDVGWGDTVRAVDLITDPKTRSSYQSYTMVKLCKNERNEISTRDESVILSAFSKT